MASEKMTFLENISSYGMQEYTFDLAERSCLQLLRNLGNVLMWVQESAECGHLSLNQPSQIKGIL